MVANLAILPAHGRRNGVRDLISKVVGVHARLEVFEVAPRRAEQVHHVRYVPLLTRERDVPLEEGIVAGVFEFANSRSVYGELETCEERSLEGNSSTRVNLKMKLGHSESISTHWRQKQGSIGSEGIFHHCRPSKQ